MPETPELSEVKRALLEKYLRGELSQAKRGAKPSTQSVQNNVEPRTPVVAIQATGVGRPFFYVHVHWVGGAFYCFTLAHALGSDQPFYVLEPYKFDHLQVPPTLEEMVAAYIKVIRNIQPEGPYLLGGFCGGCLIAFEMAQQLLAQGQAIDLLALIEAVDGPAPHRMLFRRVVCSFLRQVSSLIRLAPNKQLDWFLCIRHVYLLLRYPQYRRLHGFLRFPTIETLRQDWIGLFVWMISAYIPRRYPGKVTYFWASEKAERRKKGLWGKVAEADELDVHVIAGNHTTCRTEYIHDMAEHLRVCLDEAQVDTSEK